MVTGTMMLVTVAETIPAPALPEITAPLHLVAYLPLPTGICLLPRGIGDQIMAVMGTPME